MLHVMLLLSIITLNYPKIVYLLSERKRETILLRWNTNTTRVNALHIFLHIFSGIRVWRAFWGRGKFQAGVVFHIVRLWWTWKNYERGKPNEFPVIQLAHRKAVVRNFKGWEWKDCICWMCVIWNTLAYCFTLDTFQ